MKYRIVSTRGWLILLITMAAIAGCGDIGKSFHNMSARRADNGEFRQGAQRIDESEILRVREDLPRNRLWVLTLKEVRVYNTAITGKNLIWKMALPTWSVVGFRNVCMPDLALDRAGSAFISSNGQARLLRIDADRFDLKDFAISFKGRDGLDIGFGALAFDADGTLFGRTTPGGMLWKIDIVKARATMAAVNMTLPSDQCEITTQSVSTQLLNDFERS